MTTTNRNENHIDDSNLLENLNHVMKARREKLAKIKELGIDPYPYSFKSSHAVADILIQFDELSSSSENVRIAGRLMSIRLMGKAAFAHILDEGQQLQLYFKRDVIGNQSWSLFRLLDIGDIIGVEGDLFVTRTGEKTLRVEVFNLLAKNLRPLPSVKEKEDEVWFKWSDKEERYRQRVVDLVLNRESREILLQRSRIVKEIRNILDDEGFVEVETPVLQPLYGGAAAKPFVTYHNSLDQQFYLRIADELYLKRLISGGLNRVYEIAKDFRNEGIDRLHSPEFTMLECYAAYEDYNYCAELLEKMLPALVGRLSGQTEVKYGEHSINLAPPYRRVTMEDLVRDCCGVEIIGREQSDLAAEITRLGIEVDSNWGVGKLIDVLFSEKVEPELIQPTFVFDYPVELSPLAKKHREKPGLVERFELFAAGLEIANAFSELNDPLDQRDRFEAQARLREAGDEEAHPIDENYLETLEIGMPPTGGLGVGVDRIVMLLTDTHSIKDVILFPALRTKDKDT